MKTAEIIDELKSMVNNYVVLNGQYVIPKSVLDIYIEHLETAEQTQPVSSKLHLPNLEIENKGNQTYGEFMRSNPELPPKEVTDSELEKEAEELYPYFTGVNVGLTFEQDMQRAAHIKAAQIHRNDGLNQLIEWMEWESHRRWNESNELPDFTEILTKAKEIKSSLNK